MRIKANDRSLEASVKYIQPFVSPFNLILETYESPKHLGNLQQGRQRPPKANMWCTPKHTHTRYCHERHCQNLKYQYTRFSETSADHAEKKRKRLCE